MTEHTTLAERLSAIFDRLRDALPSNPNTQAAKTLLMGWQETLGGAAGRDPLSILAGIALVAQGLEKLELQVKTSNRFRDSHRLAALETITSFKALFRVETFNQHGNNAYNICNKTACGNLSLIGVSLESEFKEPRLDKATSDEISASLKEVAKLISESDIPLELKLAMQKHVSAMLWWLSKPDIASPQDFFEACGSALLVASQIREKTADDPKLEAAGLGVWDKLSLVGLRVGKVLGWANKGLLALDKAVTDGQHMIEAAKHLST